MSERSIRIRWALIGVGAFCLLMGIEVVTEDEPVEWADFAGDALSTALIVASATGSRYWRAAFRPSARSACSC